MRETKHGRGMRLAAALLAAVLLAAGLPGVIRTAAAESAWPGETETVRAMIYTLPVPKGMAEGESEEIQTKDGQMNRYRWQDSSGKYRIGADVISHKKSFVVNAETVQAEYAGLTDGIETLWMEEITLDRTHPALALATSTLREPQEGADWEAYTENQVSLLYYLGSNLLMLTYESREAPDADPGLQPKKDEWLPVLAQVSYSVPEGREGLPDWLVTLDSFVCTINGKNGQRAVAAGKSLQLTAELAEEKRISAMNAKLKKVYWILADTEVLYNTGALEAPDASVASISQSGVLKGGKVTEPKPVTAIALNEASEYVASKNFLILPAQASLALSEKAAELYVGESAPLALAVSAEPEETLLFSAEYTNVEWTVDKPDLLEMQDDGQGTVTLTAKAAGKAVVTVKDTVSGKSAKAVITLLTPVTEIAVDGADTVAPGKAAQYKAVLTPEKPSSKKVTWSLEAGEEYAALSKDGKLTVKKDAPAGTEIVIACRAEGSSLERVARKTVTVGD